MTEQDFEDLVRYAPRLFPGLAQLVEACWGWQSYDTTEELRDNLEGMASPRDEALVAGAWIQTRSKPTAVVDMVKLRAELTWMATSLDETQLERVFVRLGMVSSMQVERGGDQDDGSYRTLCWLILIHTTDWLQAHDDGFPLEFGQDLAEAIDPSSARTSATPPGDGAAGVEPRQSSKKRQRPGPRADTPENAPASSVLARYAPQMMTTMAEAELPWDQAVQMVVRQLPDEDLTALIEEADSIRREFKTATLLRGAMHHGLGIPAPVLEQYRPPTEFAATIHDICWAEAKRRDLLPPSDLGSLASRSAS